MISSARIHLPRCLAESRVGKSVIGTYITEMIGRFSLSEQARYCKQGKSIGNSF